jgi:hypothetical protein
MANWRTINDYYQCPFCMKRTVILKLRPSRGGSCMDTYECIRRACTFECYVSEDACQIDRQNMAHLLAINDRLRNRL